ncbi:hypothetical protein ACA910_014777 [Epithemia clementina (nom. ined.)]
MNIKDKGIVIVLKTKKAAFVDPMVNQSKLDGSWLEDWKNMMATKEEWLDEFVSGVCLFLKKLMAEEDFLFSVKQGKNNMGDDEGGFLSKENTQELEETTLDEAEVSSFSAELFNTPKTSNKRKQLWFLLDQGVEVDSIDFLPTLPENEDEAVQMLQEGSNFQLHLAVKLDKELWNLGLKVKKINSLGLQVDSELQESTEKILINLVQWRAEMGNSRDSDILSDHRASTIWRTLLLLSNATQLIDNATEDWERDSPALNKIMDKLTQKEKALEGII